jgi:hypothetical protein
MPCLRVQAFTDRSAVMRLSHRASYDNTRRLQAESLELEAHMAQGNGGYRSKVLWVESV